MKSPKPTSTKKAFKPRGRPEKDIAHVQRSIPYSADKIPKAILKAPPDFPSQVDLSKKLISPIIT